MTLILNTNGQITCPVPTDKKEMVLNNQDLENVLFSSIILKENFNITSLLNIFKNYPILLTIFPIMKDYLTEFELIDLSKIQESDITIVMTPVVKIFHNLHSNQISCECFSAEGVYQPDMNIAILELKDYCKFKIAINLLSVFETEIGETSEVECSYVDINPEEYYNLLNFLKPLVDTITACGTVRERNYVVNELIKEKTELQDEVNKLSESIMKRINLIKDSSKP